LNVFIIFVKFFDWIVAIWMRLAQFIKEKGGLRFLEGGPTTKIKYIITIKINNNKKFDLGGSGPTWVRPCTDVMTFRFYVSIISIGFGQFRVIDK